MAQNKVFFDWKIGQFVCVLCVEEKYVPMWYFAKIAKIISAKTYTETMVEVYLYSVPETYPEWENERLADMYPSLVMSREMIMLARLKAGIKPKEENRFKMVRVPIRDLCLAEPMHFLNRLTEGKNFSLRRKQY
jgi:hypothetical protein